MTTTSRILPSNREVRGHVANKDYTKALDFFCDKFKKESSADAAEDTKEEFGVTVCVEKSEELTTNNQPIKVYDVYIGPKEHS